jgi:hypothetical protein
MRAAELVSVIIEIFSGADCPRLLAFQNELLSSSSRPLSYRSSLEKEDVRDRSDDTSNQSQQQAGVLEAHVVLSDMRSFG